VIKFVIDIKTFVLKVQPKLDNNLGWDLKIFCDSNWAGDPGTRVSVTGFIIYLLNVPICWCSKSQKGVTPNPLKDIKIVRIATIKINHHPKYPFGVHQTHPQELKSF
jgi:hypothetical protein